MFVPSFKTINPIFTDIISQNTERQTHDGARRESVSVMVTHCNIKVTGLPKLLGFILGGP